MSDNFWDHLGDIAVLAAAAWALSMQCSGY